MAIGIDDLDDDDILQPGEKQVDVTPPPMEEVPSQEDDYIQDFLKTRGIDDYSKIKFEDENNQIIERNWKDLSKEEKFNILNTPLQEETSVEDNNQLTSDEINLINQIRQSNMSPEDYIKQFSSSEPVEPQYKIDELSDDEVYLLDLESRVGELSDEDAVQALTNAKLNEDFYKKQVEGIRKEYKEREDYQNQQEQASLEEERQQAFQEYQNKVIDAIDNFNSIGNLDLNFEDNDKEELAQFMLSQDENGVNYLYQALQEPETLAKAAWFILNGEEAFNSISDYFINQIKLVSENQYKKGLEDGKKGISSRPTLVIDNSKKTNVHRQYKTIEDLDDED